jgi:hypothetical protein
MEGGQGRQADKAGRLRRKANRRTRKAVRLGQ